MTIGFPFCGRFPLAKLVEFYDFADINRAIDDSDARKTVEPVVRMSHG